MTALFSVSLAVGIVGLLAVVATGERWAERQVIVRRSVAALLAFGLAGMSASFAGLGAGLALLLAAAAAAAYVVYSDRADADHQ